AWSLTNRTARALNSSSYFFGMMRTTFPRKKVCIELGAVQVSLVSRTAPGGNPSTVFLQVPKH
ncbi:hypothetical protein, partial [Mycobacterium paraintracellulare]|uniref:hypothetical protein n=1 Tax=Mycobacterium paraintracellulare TaxID=1138383 RepID=UPI001F2A4293